MASLMEKNFLRLHDLNKRVAEARKRVEHLKKRRTALYLRKRRVDVQTWMLNSLVDDACRNLEVLLNPKWVLMIRIDRKKLVNKFKISFCVKRLVSEI